MASTNFCNLFVPDGISAVFKVLVIEPLYRAVASTRFEFVKFFASRLVWSIPKFVAVVVFRCRVARGGVCSRVDFIAFAAFRLYKSFAREPWLNGSPRACTS